MLQFNDQRWTVGECNLKVALPLHSQNLPEAWWSLDASARLVGRPQTQEDLRICVEPFFAPIRDWRELQNFEINIDAAWQDAHEFVNEEGEVQWCEIEARWWPDRSVNKAQYWIGDQFQLRFGSLETDRLICELEGTLEREEKYYRDPPTVTPENSETNNRPNSLLLMDRVQLRQCEIEVPGDAREPLAWAHTRAARILGLRAFRSTHMRRIGNGNESACSWKVTLTPSFND